MRMELQQYLAGIDKRQTLEFVLESYEIRKILAPIEAVTESDEMAEAYAFNFRADTDWHSSQYYNGVQYIDSQKQNTVFPDREKVTEVMQKYWQKRAHGANNQVLKCRYLNLTLDFIEYGEQRNIIIEESVDAATSLILGMKDVNLALLREYVFRILWIVLSIKNDTLISRIVDSLTEYAKRTPEAASEIYIVMYGIKTIRKNYQSSLESVICSLEAFLNKAIDGGAPFVINFQGSLITLCDFYKRDKHGDKLKKILEKTEEAYRQPSEFTSRVVAKVSYLGELYEIYGRYREFQFAKNAQTRISIELSDCEKEMQKEMKEYTFEYKVSEDIKKAIEDCIENIFDNTSKKLDIATCTRIFASPLSPRKQDIDKAVAKSNQQNNLMNLLNQEIIGEYGYKAAVLRKEESENRLLHYYSDYIMFMEPLYDRVMNELVNRFDSEDLVQILNNSPLCRDEDAKYFKKTVKYFWAKDYYGFCALVIPLIESMFRELNRQNNQPIINANPNDDGGYDFLSLGTLCDNKMTRDIFGDDFVFFCKTTLLSPFGWNIRNNFCHGLNKNLIGSTSVAYRLMYILLSMCIVGESEKVD